MGDGNRARARGREGETGSETQRETRARERLKNGAVYKYSKPSSWGYRFHCATYDDHGHSHDRASLI